MTASISIRGENHQRAFHVKKPLKDFIHKPKQHPNSGPSLPLPSLPSHDRTKEEYVYDVLYECQRGSWIVGFSSKTLLQFDPDPWCDKDMRFTPMNIKTYQLPDPTWEWVHKQWMVDMTEDVDEAGWQYALKFHGASWHGKKPKERNDSDNFKGNYKHFRSFVRKRRWIRLRHHSLLDESITTTVSTNNTPEYQEQQLQLQSQPQPQQHIQQGHQGHQESQTTHKEQKLVESLQNSCLDRERLCYIKFALNGDRGYLSHMLMSKAKEYMEFFDFDVSRRNFVEILIQHQRSCGIPIDPKDIQPALKSITYYSDLQAILSQLKSTQ
ncbi:hypothetical protein PHYBLDRAFT_181393 [Phycomyces blakesleeanus NRRL 1555(-)]|uniref:TECPR1-like DysF domain-containing protein n=1 Tax=Phycomyces blakesleeanus (strain ATCC 8743b / DSM 1359 / FGSC 10004 / NBRC 33097 / NRRL 1555) TaxID=763407 RepID=A0A162UBL3_PHYB8|nr:hypothetical protein PHYBLDRAFT_181393 [Phycomyces blakesleeanus NRRL 1555(-)]OAD73863.1 hypothetical protein PHYBLDRAFT_181393 [Phycomyces blakesleeanus NRRL 1555(-)]|eukprot:XP_018291903.1 hypothetical protein PHYBLDRAFT_181393 [Phycomyces blakesleeanus NRRL 1555(-)]